MNFKKYRIADLIDDISMGPFGSNIKVDCFVDSGVPVLNGSNLDGFTLKEESFRYVTEQKADSLKRANAKKGDIVITHRGTLGQIVYIPQNAKYERYVISQSQFRIRCNGHVLPEYLVFYFHTRVGQHKILSNASQVGVPALARPSTTFQQIEVELPDIEVQKKIVSILQSFNDKIELNNKINANLQQQAQAIFKSWFVDFERFQDGEFVESEFGPIPKGWRVGELSEVATITMGQSPSGKSYNEEGNGSVFFQGRAEFGDRFPTRRLCTTEPKRMAEANSVLMSVRAPVGDINVAYEKCCIGRGLASIQSKFEYSSYMLYQMLSLKRQLDVFNGEGTVFGSINRDTLNAMKVLIPNEDSIEKFECTVAPMDKLVRANYDEICRLETARDTLLPKLMNGEIEVQ